MAYSAKIQQETQAGHDRLNRDDYVDYNKPPPRPEKNPQFENDLRLLKENGYVVLKNLLRPHQIRTIKAALSPYLEENTSGRNNFEGFKTQRIYALLNKSRAFDQLLLQPRLLYLLDNMLYPKHLLTAFQAIQINPHETPQPFHYDDQFVKMPRPRDPTSIASIWAIDDFTKENGGTQVVRGSHLWGDDRMPTAHDDITTVEMPAGSCVVFIGTLWHRGGRNVSSRPRLAMTSQHCQPWIRPQENQFLAVPPSKVLKLNPRIQEMMGYSIHFPFIGHVNGFHPIRYIEDQQRERESKL